jgi:hypothetical protein
MSAGHRWSVESVASALGPATLITVLLVHVSYTRGRAYFSYFGIGQGILNVPVETYLLRSSDATFGVAVYLVSAATLLVTIDRALGTIRARSPKIGEFATWVLLIVSGGAATGSLAFALTQPAIEWANLFALILALGSALALRCVTAQGKVHGGSLYHHKPWAALLTVTVVLGSFWAATLYAQRLGQEAAKLVDDDPGRLPLVTVFTPEYNDIAGSFVQVKRIGQDETSAWRYTGLRLLTYADGHWFLITGRYDSSHRSTVTVLRNTESVRLEIAAAAQIEERHE